MNNMTSEVENLLKGTVSSTAEYDSFRKLIGVAQENLMPNANGVAPLSKQNAFAQSKPEVNTTEQVSESAQAVQPTVESQPTQQPNPTPIAPQQVSTEEPVLENPVNIANPNTLSTLTEPKQEETPVSVEPEKKEPVLDLQMPQIQDETIGVEPEKTNENLFNNEPVVAAPTQMEKSENINLEEVNKKIDETKEKLKLEIDKVFEELKKSFDVSKEQTQTVQPTQETKVEENNTLVNDALNQINNMVIPSLNQTETLNNSQPAVPAAPQTQNTGVDLPQLDDIQMPTISL